MSSAAAATGGRASAAVTQAAKAADATTATPPKKMDLNPPRGTRDFYPEDMALRSWLFQNWRDVASQHAFCEYDSPVLESEALYVRKAGEDVSAQLYSFEDRSSRRLALRPEMTPSLARMVLSRRRELPVPIKWFSIPQCWRYERTTRGRRREHFQWNMDIWGIEGLSAEAELLSAAVGFMRRVGLSAAEVGIKVSTRAVLAELLAKLGVPDERFATTCVLVDKLDKLPAEQVRAALVEDGGLSAEVADSLLATLAVRDFAGLEAAMGADSPALRELRELFELADAHGFREWLVLDISVVRGLAYYTGVVFEGFDRKGELRALVGGGRYDRLLSTLGADDMPAVGFGFGDAVIVELLKVNNLLPATSASAVVSTGVSALEPGQVPSAVKLASALRAQGVTVDLVLECKKPKWVFKHAERLQARFVAIIGDAEHTSGAVRIKDTIDGTQHEVPISEAHELLRSL